MKTTRHKSNQILWLMQLSIMCPMTTKEYIQANHGEIFVEQLIKRGFAHEVDNITTGAEPVPHKHTKLTTAGISQLIKIWGVFE